MDAVRTAVRTGSKEVFILYRRTRAEMPAAPEEIEEALEEGIKMEFLVAPVRVVGKDGKVTGIECLRMELGEPDASGRRRPIPIKGSEFQSSSATPSFRPSARPADLSFITKESGVSINKWNNIDIDAVTFATNVPGVFAGGDVVTGPATVVKAVNAGKEAAKSIDRYLKGEDVKAGRAKDWTKGLADQGDAQECDESHPRKISAHGSRTSAKQTSRKSALGFTEAQAMAEAEPLP